jgi:hypothetical protein
MQIITKKAAGCNLRILTAILMFVLGTPLQHAWAQENPYERIANYVTADETKLKVEFKVVYPNEQTHYDESKVIYPAKNDKYQYNDFCYVRVLPTEDVGENLPLVTPDQIRKAIRNEINKRKAEYDKAGGKEAPGYKDAPVCEMPYILNLDLAYLGNIFEELLPTEEVIKGFNNLRDSLAINSIVYLAKDFYISHFINESDFNSLPNFAIKVHEFTPSHCPNSDIWDLQQGILGESYSNGLWVSGEEYFTCSLGDITVIDKQPFYVEWPICQYLFPFHNFIYKRLDTYENSNEGWTTFVPPFEFRLDEDGFYRDEEGKPVFQAFVMQTDDFMTDMTQGPQGTDYAGSAHFANPYTMQSASDNYFYLQHQPLLIHLNKDYQSGEEGVGYIVKQSFPNGFNADENGYYNSIIQASKGSSFYDMDTEYYPYEYYLNGIPAKIYKGNKADFYTDEDYIYMGVRHFRPFFNTNTYKLFEEWYTLNFEYTPARSEGVRHDMKGTFCGVKHRSIENEGEGNVIYYLAQNKLYSTGNFDKGDQYINAYPFRAWIETRADASAPGKALPLSLSIIADELEGETTGIKELATDDNSTLAIQPGTGTLTFSSKTDRSIAIYDISGRMAANKKIKAGVPQTVSLKPGIYMIEGHKFAVK